jgi:UDP-N-acetylglucosamine---dolichyl-phosphate N-acetylglucosaminyltransferase
MIANPSNVAIIIPSFNEGPRIEQVVKAIINKGFTTIVVIDDGSTDDSMLAIKKLNPIILTHIVNRGAGAATETGLKYCREVLLSDTVIMIDADAQHDTDDIALLLTEHYKQNADITIGNRFINSTENVPLKHIIFNIIANLFTSILSGKWVHDSQSGFKVFNQKALNNIILEQNKYEHCSEIFIKAHKLKLKIIDVPIHVYYPHEIKSKGQHFVNGIKTFYNLLHSVLFKNK